MATVKACYGFNASPLASSPAAESTSTPASSPDSSPSVSRTASVQDVMNWGSSTNVRADGAVAGMKRSASGHIVERVQKKAHLCEGDVEELGGVPAENTSSLLILYCGGTIGMKTKNGVYVPEPQFLVNELRRQPMLHDQNYAATHLTNDSEKDMLVMLLPKEGRRILYNILEYDPLLDSSNMTYDDYARLATDIMKYYTKYDGFVILHGTDTMAYTASALSFMLENLGKPVILTGSQIPIFESRSDGLHNFINSMIFAAHYNIPEVAIYFDSVLLRGNRSTKVDNIAFEAFGSPNLEPLATVGVSIKVNWEAIFRHRGLKKFEVHTRMCRNVGVLRLFPGITESTVRAFLQPPMEGVVLQTYGQGNWPTARADLMAVLKEACDRGVIIINTTQCARGIVSPIYACGKDLLDIGVIAGSDMTVEAALMKLSYILGKDEWSLDEKRAKVGECLRGEMAAVAVNEDRRLLHFSLIETLADTMRLSSSEEIQLLREAVFPYLLCAAAREGNIDALEKLRQAGAQFQMSDYDGRTALHVACCEGHADVVQYLLDLGAPVHVRDRYGDSPLDDAVTFHRNDIVRMLRDTGAHLTMTPAKMAVSLGSVVVNEEASALESWWEAGADFNVTDYNGRTPLHVAAASGRLEHIKVLLSHGANPRVADNEGRSPLNEAADRNFKEIVQLLKATNFSN